MSRCKACINGRINTPERRAKTRETYAADRERHRARERELAKQRPYRPRYDPKRSPARAKLHRAIKQGRIVKPDHCEDCGEHLAAPQIHAHHHDYDKPYEVEWLCSICHGKRHRKDEVAA